MIEFDRGSLEYMMSSTLEFRKLFVKRLNQACDLSQIVPPPNHGRYTFLSERLEVSVESVSRWFKAVAMPRPDVMQKLAELLEVDQSWLAMGVQPEIPRSERKVHAARTDGAVALVWGMMTLAGGHCGYPSKNDARSNYVDFYATMRGTNYAIYVALAREVSRDRFDVILPKEYADVRTIAVVPAGPGRYHFLDMPLPMIEEHKVRKSGSVIISFSRIERDRYNTGRDAWPRIKSFQELV